jgi:hypothetical protein
VHAGEKFNRGLIAIVNSDGKPYSYNLFPGAFMDRFEKSRLEKLKHGAPGHGAPGGHSLCCFSTVTY